MKYLLVLFAAFGSSAAEWTLYTCGATTKGYVVGAKLLPSGVFRRSGAGQWQQVGHPDPFIFALDYDRRDPSKLYAAAGNGIIRLTAGSSAWKILTGSDVTEMRDISIARDGTIYYGYVAGIRASRDGGATWQEVGPPTRRRYTEAVRVDREKSGVVLAGTEEGIFRTENGGQQWTFAGAGGFGVMHLEQSPHDACFWLAVTQGGGIFGSQDCGKTFENIGRTGVDATLYDVSFDPTTPGRIALAGWGPGVMVSEDNGRTWAARNAGLPSTEIWSVGFDPAHPGRLFASVHEEAVYLSGDAGKSWTRDGLENGLVYRMRFVPESR